MRERPKYSLIIQKPASLTWSQKTEPAPTLSTIRAAIAELEPNWCAIGATRPDAVIAATVEEPRETRSRAVISHAARIGEMLVWANRLEMYLEIPPSTRTCLKAPPPPIISSITEICLMDKTIESVIWFIVLFRCRPMVKMAKINESSIARSGAPTNWMNSLTGLLLGKMNEQMVAMAIRITGIMAVKTEMPNLGVSSSLNSL